MEPAHISRREFDGAIERAYWRWELLRRDASYRRRSDDLFTLWAEAFFSSPGRRMDRKRLAAYCLKRNGGVIPAQADAEGRRLYDEILKQYGLRVILHPAVCIPLEDMAAFPIFVDTPGRQPVVVEKDLLRRLAMEAYGKLGQLPHIPANPLDSLDEAAIPELPERRLHKAIKKCKVERAGSWFNGERIHFDTLRRDLDVFDLRTSGVTLVGAAKRLGISVEEAKRAWARASTLIRNHQVERWDESPMEAHCDTCQTCQPWFAGKPGAEPCPQMNRLLEPGPRRRRGERTVDLTQAHLYQETTLDLLSARSDGSLPTRSSRT